MPFARKTWPMGITLRYGPAKSANFVALSPQSTYHEILVRSEERTETQSPFFSRRKCYSTPPISSQRRFGLARGFGEARGSEGRQFCMPEPEAACPLEKFP